MGVFHTKFTIKFCIYFLQDKTYPCKLHVKILAEGRLGGQRNGSTRMAGYWQWDWEWRQRVWWWQSERRNGASWCTQLLQLSSQLWQVTIGGHTANIMVIQTLSTLFSQTQNKVMHKNTFYCLSAIISDITYLPSLFTCKKIEIPLNIYNMEFRVKVNLNKVR